MSASIHSCPPAPIHPLLWKANQLARTSRPGLETGHADLSRCLPGQGWPLGSLTELLLDQAGIGELRLLMPALARLPAHRSIALLHPPHAPCLQAWTAHRIAPSQLLWIAPEQPADTLWAAEQILKHGHCGALLCWSASAPAAALRRLHLAAQSGDTAFFMFRPTQAAHSASPAPLRLQLRPAGDRLRVDILKRRGPLPGTSLLLPLISSAPARAAMPSQARHATVDQRLPDATQPRRLESVLAG
ncbi:hypothetical protein PIGHUM_02420 [Pigmentiphaga humi]|uniref:SOS cell division inhibitor n=2 Tax=Pigmentiphaga humi TaxID=2478468 RepID=A0A3P4B3Z0_9BURK|nr:hypothetical protein PIGHUM_02420 [Pigmentiphaga humi]